MIEKMTYSEFLKKSPLIKDLLKQSEKYTRTMNPVIFENITGINLKLQYEYFNEGDIVIFSYGLIENEYSILRKEFNELYISFPVLRVKDCSVLKKIYDSKTGVYYA
jgi:hypothetical protein